MDNNNLADIDEVFNNKTLTYRINGFALACKMDNIQIKNKAVTSHSIAENTKLEQISNTIESDKNNDGSNYFIAVNKGNEQIKGKFVTISGHYDDLNFSFTNYYGKKNINKKIVEIPFQISLVKAINQDNYILNIETIDGIETQFILNKYREYKKRSISNKIVFYANILDFSNILKLVKSFVYNPQIVFDTYNEIKESKKITFTNSELTSAIMQNKMLDKPDGKVTKKIKKLFYNKY